MSTRSPLAARWVFRAKSLLYFFLAVFALGSSWGARAAGQPPAKKSAVLFVPYDDYLRFPDRIAGELAAERFVTTHRNSADGLTLDYLRQFNAAVIYCWEPDQMLNAKQRAGFDALRAFVREGGGLLVTATPGDEYVNELLAPLGAKMLVEQILDNANFYRKTPLAGFTFAWTDRILAHPATKGVTGLCYAVDRVEPGTPGVLPLKADANWQVLIKGMPAARTFHPTPASLSRTDNGSAGSYKESPPLLAVREFGKGRVALWPAMSCYTLADGYSIILDGGVVMHSQQGDRHSDGARLTYNLLHWLSEPSSKLAEFGKYQPPPPQPPPPLQQTYTPLDWSKTNDFGPTFSHAYMGLIGARTGLSTGEGTPEEFIAAAQQAGYEFIAFSEDINNMSKENWDKLVAACTKATTDKFLALPGIYYQDNEGDAFVVIGDIGYPPPAWGDPKNPKNKILFNGTIRMALSAKGIPPIIMLPLPSNKRPARYHSSFYGYASQVWENGKPLVEDWKDYVELQKEGLQLFPTSVHLVKRPGDVAAAHRQGMQAFVRADSLATLVRSIDEGHNGRYGWWIKPAYPSSGPEIGTFQAENWGTSDQAVPGADRYRLQMLVRSPKGLAEVQLYDRGTLVRRFLLNGAKEFKRTLDQYHSQQQSYIMVAVDVDGGKAISWARRTEVQEYNFIMCTDNMNDMGPGGKAENIDMGRIMLGGAGGDRGAPGAGVHLAVAQSGSTICRWKNHGGEFGLARA